MNNSNLYRQQALKKLTSPERLNQMIFITSPRSWLAVLGIAVITGTGLAWGFFGVLPRNVRGNGILIQSGGVTEVATIASGKVEHIFYSEGDKVEEDAIIATIQQPQLDLKLQNAAKKLEELHEKYERMKALGSQDIAMRRDLLMKKQEVQQSIIEANESRLQSIKQRIASQEVLLKDSLITEFTLSSTRQSYYELQQEVELKRNEMKGINLELFEMDRDNELDMNALQEQIFELEREIVELRSEFVLNSSVKSPAEGRVVEVQTNPGRVVSVGEIIITLELTNKAKELEAVIYMPPSEGKKVEKGMEVKISPSTVEVETYGYIEGVVKHVSEYPASQPGMERVLGNSELARTFASDEPPIAVIVRLNSDPNTESGYKWTSKLGPNAVIKSGTLCNAFITIEKQRPITLLFPSMKKNLKY